MADRYKHGTSGELGPSVSTIVEKLRNAAVYIGRAPVHLSKNGGVDAVDRPVLITSFQDAVDKIGYLDDWENWDLCEAVDAHFRNSIQPIGPIVVINVFDPAEMSEEVDTPAEINLRNGRGVIKDALCIPSSIAIEGKKLGEDYVTGFDADSGNVTLRDLKGTLTSPLSVTYRQAKPEQVTADMVIGDLDADENLTGIKAIATINQKLGVIPNILCSPGWSADAGVHAALISASQRIDDQWYAFVHSEIPLTDEVNTLQKAVDWKKQSNHTSECEAPCWPMARKGNKRYHISTLATVVAMQTDAANGGAPYETPSNKPVDITGYFVSEDKYTTYLRTQANTLNEAGIRTVAYNGGRWVLWGPHTGAYGNEEACDIRSTFDCTIRMMYYILNEFQFRYGPEIDKPMNKNRIESIVTEYQGFIEGFISSGALLYGKMEFREDENPTSDIAKGEFVFNVQSGNTPPARAMTIKVSYTDKGLDSLFGESE